MTSSPTRSRAADLLAKVLASGWYEPVALAGELVVSEDTLDQFLTGKTAMPLDRQLCLALFVIERIPPLARLGHRLHGQVQAALAFHERPTTTDASKPTPRFR